jgi:hypothetical protein
MPPTVNTKEDAPNDDVYLMFSLLTEENKEKAIQFIADLKEMQQSLLP